MSKNPNTPILRLGSVSCHEYFGHSVYKSVILRCNLAGDAPVLQRCAGIDPRAGSGMDAPRRRATVPLGCFHNLFLAAERVPQM